MYRLIKQKLLDENRDWIQFLARSFIYIKIVGTIHLSGMIYLYINLFTIGAMYFMLDLLLEKCSLIIFRVRWTILLNALSERYKRRLLTYQFLHTFILCLCCDYFQETKLSFLRFKNRKIIIVSVKNICTHRGNIFF